MLCYEGKDWKILFCYQSYLGEETRKKRVGHGSQKEGLLGRKWYLVTETCTDK
jgi:hypothetical protein